MATPAALRAVPKSAPNWAALLKQRAAVRAQVTSIVGDATLDTAPAAGQETSWLSQLATESAADLAKAKAAIASGVKATVDAGKQVAGKLKTMLGSAVEAAKAAAPSVVPALENVAKDAALATAIAAGAVTAPLWMPFLLFLAWEYWLKPGARSSTS